MPGLYTCPTDFLGVGGTSITVHRGSGNSLWPSEANMTKICKESAEVNRAPIVILQIISKSKCWVMILV